MSKTDNVPAERLIDGKGFAQGLQRQVAEATQALKDKHGITPGLAVVIVGEDPASQVYVRMKTRRSEEAGFESIHHSLPAETTQADLLALVDKLNKDPKVHGILVQMPLPEQIDEQAIIDAVDPDKDVDGFHVVNVGKLNTGRSDGHVPCTPKGCMMLVKDHLGDLSGLHAVVLGRSNIVGRPLVSLLTQANCTVTQAHSRTRDLPAVCRQADILMAAVGKPGLVKADWVKDGATIIDVGINRVEAPETEKGYRLVGDVAFEEVAPKAGGITPVPGGVGPMTIASLLRNTVIAAHRQNGLTPPEAL